MTSPFLSTHQMSPNSSCQPAATIGAASASSTSVNGRLALRSKGSAASALLADELFRSADRKCAADRAVGAFSITEPNACHTRKGMGACTYARAASFSRSGHRRALKFSLTKTRQKDPSPFAKQARFCLRRTKRPLKQGTENKTKTKRDGKTNAVHQEVHG